MTGAFDLLPTVLASLAIGALIGAAGVGGVLLAPWLTHAIGLSVQQAVGIAMLSFIGPGIAALLTARRSSTPQARSARPMLLATIPGALAGTAALAHLPERAALIVLSVAVGLVGGRLLLSAQPAPRPTPRAVSEAAHAGTGVLVGFGSALTVTSGPMILVPWLVWRGSALPEAIVLGQLVQLPIAASASLGNVLAGTVDIAAGLAIGALLVAGVLAGQRLHAALPRVLLGRLVGVLLLVASVASFGKALR
jgi:uncharacterized membrane protein YfcA